MSFVCARLHTCDYVSASATCKLLAYILFLFSHKCYINIYFFFAFTYLSFLFYRVPVLVLPPLPQDSSNDLMEWFDESHNVFDSLKNIMLLAYSERIQRLCDMPKRAGELFWWPFTQHKLVPEEAVTVIDSRCGENFSVYQVIY